MARVDVDTGEIRTVATGIKMPGALNFDRAGTLYVMDVKASELLRVDPSTGAKTVVARPEPAIDNLAVDGEGTVVFANAAARRMLDVGEADVGRPFQDLAVSYRPAELRGRVEEAQRSGRPNRLEHLEHFRPPAEPVRLSIDVIPLGGGEGRDAACLIAFSDTTRLHTLQLELQATQESLETHVEELQSSNEELETTNEELQSINEELETTNEELQSTNEELETTNEELRSTNEALEAANEELRQQAESIGLYKREGDAVLRSMEAGIVVLDTDLRVRSWNRWNENAWGVRAEEALGKEFAELDIGLPTSRLEPALRDVLAGDWPQPDLVLTGVDRRGRPVRCRASVSPLLFESRPAQGVVVVLDDVTEAERGNDLAHYLGRVLGQSLNEVYFLDPATLRFLVANRGAERKLGYTAARLRRMTLAELLPGEAAEALRGLVERLVAGEREEVVIETRVRSADGGEHPVEMCLQHFPNEEPPILVAIAHHTAERQRLDAAG